MLELIKFSDFDLKELGLDEKSIKTMLDFINLYKETKNKVVLNSLLSDILDH